MLKSTKEQWKKKAEQDYEYAKAEEQNSRTLIENQNAWRQRFQESSWLLKGAADPDHGGEPKQLDDQKLLSELDIKLRKKHKYDLTNVGLEDIIPAASPNDKKGKKGKKAKSPDRKVRWGETMADYMGSISPLRSRDVQTAEQLAREEEARRRIQSDERRQREEFLKRNMDHIAMLEEAKYRLEHPRMPKHHKPARLMSDYHENTALTEEQIMANLRPQDRAIVNIQPIKEELKTWNEVIADDNAKRVRTIPGRYHHYLGEDCLYPFNNYPATIEVLLPVGYSKDMIPENVLLKDLPKEKKKPVVDPILRKVIEQQKQARLKRAIFDLSRLPVKQYPITPEPDLARRDIQILSLKPTEFVVQEAVNKSSLPINQQFPWRSHDYPDQNSVHQTPHPKVIFYENEAEQYRLQQLEEQRLAELREKDYDSVKHSGIHYHLLSSSSQQSLASSSTGKGGGGSNSQKLPSIASLQAMQSIEGGGNDSQNAIRSNYVAENSIRTERQIPVKLLRLRDAHNINNVHLKNELHFISLQQKEKIEHHKKEKQLEKLVMMDAKKQVMAQQQQQPPPPPR